jgi:hypothetical protein
MSLTDPFFGEIKVFYNTKNMYNSDWFKGIHGTVSEYMKGNSWDWCIEIFLGSIWHYSKGDFNKFVEEFINTWLEEFLHMIYRWENQRIPRNEEEIVKDWLILLRQK